MNKPFFTQKFSLGPPIAVHFIPDESAGFKVEITPSQVFSTSFFLKIEEPLSQKLLSWLEAYGKKEPPPLDFLPRQNNSSFQETILNTLITIPFGQTVSYGELALLSGHLGAARAVGTVCRKNKFPLFIPCHRVIQANNLLGRFAFGSFLKKTLLEFEKPT